MHGIARSNAQVIVRQNGYIAHQPPFSPGEFEINDIPSPAATATMT
ncbi:fimbria/pilus outer membrane usher protein [Salmonella enterica subsp. enterica]|nr:fimbria/pilus outer membrane usher protein [Salmonella enterica subsp. enterica]